jgi:hypothetical protein
MMLFAGVGSWVEQGGLPIKNRNGTREVLSQVIRENNLLPN